MSVVREDARFWIDKVLYANAILNVEWGKLSKLTGCTIDSPLGTAAHRPIEALIECASELIGDGSSLLSWFIFDNDCGKKGLKHSLPDGKLRSVKTVDDVLDVLGLE